MSVDASRPAAGGAPRAMSQRDFDRCAALAGDRNPIHVDPAFARGSALGSTVAPGTLLWALVGAALSRRLAVALPRGWLPVVQSLVFPAPTYVGDAVAVEASPAGAPGHWATRVRNQHGASTAEGEARVRDAAAGFPPETIDDRVALGDLESDAALLGLALGQTASATRRFSHAELDAYVDLSGDLNPPVVDAAAAHALGLPDRVLPAALVAATIEALIGSRLPGPGSGWLRQRLRFHSAAHPGEPLTVSATVTRLRRDRRLATLGCVVSAADGRSVATGDALVSVRPLG